MAEKERPRADSLADPHTWAPHTDIAPDEPQAPQSVVVIDEPGIVAAHPTIGPRFLAYLAGMVLLLGLFERSDLLTTGGLVGLVTAMAVVTVAGFGLAIHQASEERWTALTPSFYLTPLLAVLVAAAVSALVSDWRIHAGSQAAMGAAIFAVSFVTVERFRGQRRAGYDLLQDTALIAVVLVAFVVILAGINDIVLRLSLVFVVSMVSAYENLSRASTSHSRAIVGGVVTAQVVTTVAFALISQQFLDVARLGPLLLVAWYVNRGLIYHVLEGTMSVGVFVEYAIGAAVCAVLVATALMAR
jgi:hypothetical protein